MLHAMHTTMTSDYVIVLTNPCCKHCLHALSTTITSEGVNLASVLQCKTARFTQARSLRLSLYSCACGRGVSRRASSRSLARRAANSREAARIAQRFVEALNDERSACDEECLHVALACVPSRGFEQIIVCRQQSATKKNVFTPLPTVG